MAEATTGRGVAVRRPDPKRWSIGKLRSKLCDQVNFNSVKRNDKRAGVNPAATLWVYPCTIGAGFKPARIRHKVKHSLNSDESQGKMCELTHDADDCLMFGAAAGRSRRIKKEEKSSILSWLCWSHG